MGVIELTRDGTTVALSKDLEVGRAAGRPSDDASELLPQPSSSGILPVYIDKRHPPWDVWDVSGTLTSDAYNDVQTLLDTILRDPLGRGTITLTFKDSLFGLSSYEVMPAGSQAGRGSWSSGESGVTRVDNLELRVIS